jgi:nucleotide-binding universal stress UspA family protein
VAGLGEKFPDVQVNRHMPEQRAVEALVGRSAGAHCVVVGTRGLTGPRALLGSVSRSVAEQAESTVIVVRA